MQVGGVELANGGERAGALCFKVLERSSHILSVSYFLADYHFLNSMGHVRGNFDLKTMTARVGSGPSVTDPHL